MSDNINWEKIEEKPDKEFKISGEYLLSTKQTIANQEERIEEQSGIILDLKKEMEVLQIELQTKNNKILELSSQTIPSLNEEIALQKEQVKAYEEFKSTLEGEITNFKDIVDNLKQNDALKEEIITEKNNKIEELMEGLEKFQKRVDELEKVIETLPKIDEVEELKAEIKGKGEEISNLIKKIEELESRPPLEPLVSEEELENLRKRPTAEEIEKIMGEKEEKISKLENELRLKEAVIDDLTLQMQDLHGKLAQKPQVIEKSVYVEQAASDLNTKPKTIFKPQTEEIKDRFSKVEPSLIKSSERPVFKETEPSPQTLNAFKTPEPKPVIPKGSLNPQVAQLMQTIKESILNGIFANELATLLEDARDEIASIIGFKVVLNEIGNIARKLKKAPPNAQIDDESVEIFIQKIEEWSQRLI
ncbi:MAG: DUF2730 family protein [Candidatus Lokiarchaeota archaeon]|nr:DUF2730 family protein [Candidatus Lokiarchaeota archaeon]